MTFGFDEVETTLLQHHQMSRSTVDDSSGKTPQVDVLSTMDTASRTSMSSDGDYHLYVDDDAAYDRYADRQNPTWLRRIAAALGMSSRRRRADASIADAAPLNGQPDTAKRWSSTHSRNRQGACLRETMRRVLIAVPILVLLFFGLVHVLQVIMGRARLFWDDDAADTFWPSWGTPGHPGEGLANYPTDATRDVLPIACHSHNDYWRRIPLFDALHAGCTGVEADVWLIHDELYVGHSTSSLTPNRTLKNLYVNPLLDLFQQMNPSTDFANTTGHGVFDQDPDQTLVLLIDFKTDPDDLWPVVNAHLEPLRQGGYLSSSDGQNTTYRAITVVATGNAPFRLITQNESYRDIFFDAPLSEIYVPPTLPPDHHHPDDHPDAHFHQTRSPPQKYNPTNSHYASTNFHHAIGTIWHNRLSPSQLDLIRGQIRGAREQGLVPRYWNTPSWPLSLRNAIWEVLESEGVGMLNVDDLKGASRRDWRRGRRGGGWGHEIW